jgi:hypothetical protein
MKYLAAVMGLLLSVSMGMADGKCEGKEGKHEEGEHQCACQALKFGGYVQACWELGPDFENTFRIRRAYLGIGGDVSSRFSYKLLFTMPGASLALYDAYVDVKLIEYLGIRIGQFQTPIGMEKLTSSSVVLFPERTFASGFAIDRDLGVMLASRIKFIGLQVGLFNGQGRNVPDINEAKDLAARLTLKPVDWLHVGGAYQMGTNTLVEVDSTGMYFTDWDFNRWGAELTLTPWNLWLAAEFMGGADDETSLMTYYLETGWMFELSNTCFYGIQPAMRYEHNDLDAGEEGFAETRITGGLNFHFLPDNKAKLAVCYHRGWIDGEYDDTSDQFIAQVQLKFP